MLDACELDGASNNKMREATRPATYELDNLEIALDAAAPENPDATVSLAFPEGGRDAWTCLLGSALLMFPSFGFQTASQFTLESRLEALY